MARCYACHSNQKGHGLKKKVINEQPAPPRGAPGVPIAPDALSGAEERARQIEADRARIDAARERATGRTPTGPDGRGTTRRVTFNSDGTTSGGFRPTSPEDITDVVQRSPRQIVQLRDRTNAKAAEDQWLAGRPTNSSGEQLPASLSRADVERVARGEDPNNIFLGRSQKGIFGNDPEQAKTLAQQWLTWRDQSPPKFDPLDPKYDALDAPNAPLAPTISVSPGRTSASAPAPAPTQSTARADSNPNTNSNQGPARPVAAPAATSSQPTSAAPALTPAAERARAAAAAERARAAAAGRPYSSGDVSVAATNAARATAGIAPLAGAALIAAQRREVEAPGAQISGTMRLGGTVPSSSPAAPPPAAPAAPAAASGPYTIRPGDTLSQIAQRQGTSVRELMRLNRQLTDPNKIRAGATLNITGAKPESTYAGGVGAAPMTKPAPAAAPTAPAAAPTAPAAAPTAPTPTVTPPTTIGTSPAVGTQLPDETAGEEAGRLAAKMPPAAPIKDADAEKEAELQKNIPANSNPVRTSDGSPLLSGSGAPVQSGTLPTPVSDDKYSNSKQPALTELKDMVRLAGLQR